MTRKILLLLVSCLIVLSLVLASCAPAVTEEGVAPEKEMVTVKVKASDGTIVEKKMEKPKYGGTFTFLIHKAPIPWDQCYGAGSYRAKIVNEHLLIGDYTKGPAGTNETSWSGVDFLPPDKLLTGCLAESWEKVDPVTTIYHIRKGVHFHDKPPVNGREMTADDVVYSLNRLYTEPTSHILIESPGGKVPESITALDKYTVEVVAPDVETAGMMFIQIGQQCRIVPHEVIDKYGDMLDWENVCGTGPYIVVDDIAGTSTTFERNPNFWQHDPFFPENQLPYPDGLNWISVLDASTRLAALRAGKNDWLRNVSMDDAAMMLKSRPKMQYSKGLTASCYNISLRMDEPEKPYADKRVRYALNMAINNQEMLDDYRKGNGVILANPVEPLTECLDLYVPLEDLPKETQELYEYHPDKAKQLLAEAGYPDGFKFSVVCRQKDVDELSMIKAYLADIGVDLELKVVEGGVYYSTLFAKSYEDSIFYVGGFTCPLTVAEYFEYKEEGGRWNSIRVNDEKVNEAIAKIREAATADDWEGQCKAVKDILPYILGEAWWIQAPDYQIFEMWQPWLGGLHGEYAMGRYNFYGHIRYIWFDKDLKVSMGY